MDSDPGSVCQQGWGRSLLGSIWADRLVLSCMGHVLRGGEGGGRGVYRVFAARINVADL